MDYQQFGYVNATNRQDLPNETPVINKDDTVTTFWLPVRITQDVACNYRLVSIQNCEKSNSESQEDYLKDGRYGPGSVCVDIPWHNLNTEMGYHTYRMQFVNIYTNDILLLFFGYRIQDNNPEKPYYYMEHIPG